MRKHLIFIVILALMAVARFTILFHSETHVHSDEAIIGLMGKHVLEGRYFPFYMYGQRYNAGAAWESYAATIPFAMFGVGVVPLKSCIVALSLVCLVLFYMMANSLYGQRTAALATLAFALSPSLLKWHFQVRGYSWYFLSIPILTSLYLAIESRSSAKTKQVFLFGLASGLSVWCLELALTLVAALWILLVIRRRLSTMEGTVGIAGFISGYAPAIAFNFTYHFSNWQNVFVDRAGSMVWSSLLRFSTFTGILFQEMPKFFGADTVLWYYPERPASGFVVYAVSLLAVSAAVLPFLKTPSRIRQALRGPLAKSDENKDFLMLVLTAACFAAYLVAPKRVPSYFLGGCFFLSVLTGCFLHRCFKASTMRSRVLGIAMLSAILLAGISVMVEAGRRNQIETLTLNEAGDAFSMTRIPGADIEAVQHHLRRNRVSSVWTTISFVYPLIFESGETLAASDAVFGWNHRVYPEAVPWREPNRDQNAVFVIETDSPFRPAVEARCARDTGAAPLVAEYGTLTVIEERPRR